MTETDEPRHPTYGTLRDLLDQIGRDTKDGYILRIGLQGALTWFAIEYDGMREEDNEPRPSRG